MGGVRRSKGNDSPSSCKGGEDNRRLRLPRMPGMWSRSATTTATTTTTTTKKAKSSSSSSSTAFTSSSCRCGSLREAAKLGKERDKWVLINIQGDEEDPTSRALDHEVFRNEVVSDLIRTKLVLWRSRYNKWDDGEEGEEVRSYSDRFSVTSYPHVALMDPHTEHLNWHHDGPERLTPDCFVNVAISRYFSSPPSQATTAAAVAPAAPASSDTENRGRCSLCRRADGAEATTDADNFGKAPSPSPTSSPSLPSSPSGVAWKEEDEKEYGEHPFPLPPQLAQGMRSGGISRTTTKTTAPTISSSDRDGETPKSSHRGKNNDGGGGFGGSGEDKNDAHRQKPIERSTETRRTQSLFQAAAAAAAAKSATVQTRGTTGEPSKTRLMLKGDPTHTLKKTGDDDEEEETDRQLQHDPKSRPSPPLPTKAHPEEQRKPACIGTGNLENSPAHQSELLAATKDRTVHQQGAPVENVASVTTEGPPLKEDDPHLAPLNLLHIFQSGPLLWIEDDNDDTGTTVLNMDQLDFEFERQKIDEGIQEATLDVIVRYEAATYEALNSFLCRGEGEVMHWSGHGCQEGVVAEDGHGRVEFLRAEKLKDMMSRRKTPLKLVFVSACHSRRVGEAFFDAGVEFVVCCRNETDVLHDRAAAHFAKFLYLSLACGRSPLEAFESGKDQVRNCADMISQDREPESEKFVLLHRDGANANLPIFKPGGSISRLPRSSSSGARPASSPSATRKSPLVSSSSSPAPAPPPAPDAPLSERPIPAVPNPFEGRSKDMCIFLRMIERCRSILVSGGKGSGKSSLVGAAIRYGRERPRTFPYQVLWLPPGDNVDDELGHHFKELFRELRVRGGETPANSVHPATIIQKLNEGPFLLVIESKNFEPGMLDRLAPFLRNLLTHTLRVKLVIIDHGNAIASSAAEPLIDTEESFHLKPLGMRDSMILFGKLCPHVKDHAQFASSCGRYPNLQLYDICGSGIPGRIRQEAKTVPKYQLEEAMERANNSRMSRAELHAAVGAIRQEVAGLPSAFLPSSAAAAGRGGGGGKGLAPGLGSLLPSSSTSLPPARTMQRLRERLEALDALMSELPTRAQLEDHLCQLELDMMTGGGSRGEKDDETRVQELQSKIDWAKGEIRWEEEEGRGAS